MVPIGHYLFLSAALLAIGTVGVVTRRNVIIILMSIELILNAVNINLVAFSRLVGSVEGQVFAIFIITDAAAEAAVGLGIIIAFFRNRETVLADEMDILKWQGLKWQGRGRGGGAGGRASNGIFPRAYLDDSAVPAGGGGADVFLRAQTSEQRRQRRLRGQRTAGDDLCLWRHRAVDRAAGGAARRRGSAFRLGARGGHAYDRGACGQLQRAMGHADGPADGGDAVCSYRRGFPDPRLFHGLHGARRRVLPLFRVPEPVHVFDADAGAWQ